MGNQRFNRLHITAVRYLCGRKLLQNPTKVILIREVKSVRLSARRDQRSTLNERALNGPQLKTCYLCVFPTFDPGFSKVAHMCIRSSDLARNFKSMLFFILDGKWILEV